MKIDSIWPLLSIGDICQVIAGQSPPSSSYNSKGIGLPFYQGKADFGEIYPNTRFWCDKPTKIAQKYDILLSVRAPVGPTNICNKKSCIGRGLSSIRPGLDVHYKYLFYFFRRIEKWLSERGRGSTFSAITQPEIKNIKIPLPPMEEQRRIVAVLDRADGLRRKRRQAMEILDDLLRATFLHMFGDPITNPKGWKIEKLWEILDYITSGSRGWAKYYSDTGDLFLRIQNVGKNQLLLDDICFVKAPKNAEANRTRVKPGDILLSITADIGRSAVIPEGLGEAYINQHLALVRLKKGFNSLYISQFLCSEGSENQYNKYTKGGVKAGLNFNDIKSLKIVLPPVDLQERFGEIVGRVEGIRERMEKSLAEMDNLFSSLLQRAFKGELDLKGELIDKIIAQEEAEIPKEEESKPSSLSFEEIMRHSADIGALKIAEEISRPQKEPTPQLLSLPTDKTTFLHFLKKTFGRRPFTFPDILNYIRNDTRDYETVKGLVFAALQECPIDKERGLYLKQCFFEENFDSGDPELNDKLRGTVGFQICEEQ